MNIIRTGIACAAAALFASALSGCSEVGFQDAFGAGKWSPDSTQVASNNHALSMPPDLQLHPPGQQPPPPQPGAYQNQAYIQQQPQPGQYQPQPVPGDQQQTQYGAASIPVYQAPGDHTASTSPAPPAAAGQAPAAADQFQSAALSPPAGVPQEQAQPMQAQPLQAQPQPAPGTGAAPQSITPGTQPAATAPAPTQDAYARYGISRTRPDGSPKTDAELRAELKAKAAEAKKAQNPNYGTIWNLGSVWSDD